MALINLPSFKHETWQVHTVSEKLADTCSPNELPLHREGLFRGA